MSAGLEPFDHIAWSQFFYKIAHVGATPYELSFSPLAIRDWADENWIHAVVWVVGYLLFCHYGVLFMENRKPWDIRYLLAVWNGALSLFSFMGVLRTVPFLVGYIIEFGYEGTVCNWAVDTYGGGPTGLWVMLFIFSKIPELFDTVFIVLRKRPLIFLHWYHHATVLLYCWNSYTTRAAAGLYFVCMNYSVHAVMYLYYSLQALRLVPKWFPTFLITIAQISQMFIGTFVCTSAWYFKLSGHTCHNAQSNLTAGALMYGSYFVLFAQFFFQRFPDKSQSSKASNKASGKKSQ